MPFITEELWQALKGYLKDAERLPQSIMIASYPAFDRQQDLLDEEAEQCIQVGNQVVQVIRNARSEFKVSPSARATAVVSGRVALLAEQQTTLESLANAQVSLQADFTPPAPKDYRSYVLDHVQTHVYLPGLVDLEQERRALEQQHQEARTALERLEARLSDQTFRSKAPKEVIEREQQRAAALREKLRDLEAQLHVTR
jgi:valyl-tRNA synthetase